MRIGIDFADVDAAESILPTGQSGNVFSPFYDNQADLYHAGQFRKQRMDRADIEAHETARAHFRFAATEGIIYFRKKADPMLRFPFGFCGPLDVLCH